LTKYFQLNCLLLISCQEELISAETPKGLINVWTATMVCYIKTVCINKLHFFLIQIYEMLVPGWLKYEDSSELHLIIHVE